MTFNPSFKVASLALCVVLTGCGSSGSDAKKDSGNQNSSGGNSGLSQGKIIGPHSTGSLSMPEFVYYDLDTNKVIALTSEQAAANSEWDIAFKRGGVYLNQHNDNSVTAYATGNNSEFFDGDGKVITASFIAATADAELADYLAVTTSAIPTDDTKFVGDKTSNIIEGFYNYDFATHVVTPAATNYFIVNSDDAYAKFNVTAITTVGRAISQITFNTAMQGAGDADFQAPQSLVIDASTICSGAVGNVYIDFAINQQVTVDDEWDISLPCAADKTGADFKINIAGDSKAMHDFDNTYTAIAPEVVRYLPLKENIYTVTAFEKTKWYQYGVNGGHLFWSQFDVYLVKTATKTHKLQITSYYDSQGVSGNISFRADELTATAGTAQ